MKELAPGLWQLKGALPLPNSINTYLIGSRAQPAEPAASREGDVLVDAGARFDGKKILKQLEGHDLAAHALTHAHPDHQGASKLVCETRGVPFWVPVNDVEKAEHPDEIRREQPENAVNKLFFKTMAGPGHPVDRALNEGDEVAGFKVLDTPGHSKGHVSFWRESDRVLILGDVLNNMDVFTGIPGLREPKKMLTPDPELNRTSIKKLGALQPSLVCFGHGAPLRDTAKFTAFCAAV